MLPASSRSHYQRLQRLQFALLLAVRRGWRRMSLTGSWSEQYVADVGPKLAALVAAAQIAAAREADRYIAEVLTELGIIAAEPGIVVPRQFAGYAGDGREVSALLAQAVPHAGRRLNDLRAEHEARRVAAVAAMPTADLADAITIPVTRFDSDLAARQALAGTERWLEMVAATILADTARAAESAAMAARPQVRGYVRMLNPPSCSRCAILAGRFYRWNAGFERHPGCDCVHIPSRESLAGDLTVNPNTYFDSLSTADQDRIFTKVGAQAIRDGADINQIVNARRGMRRAQLYGHDVILTTEGATRRGFAYGRLSRGTSRNTDTRTDGGRYFRTRSPRLMPESIYQIAGNDRDEAIRLLRAHGFIL